MTTDLSVSTTAKPSVVISGSIAIQPLPGAVTTRIEAIFESDLPVLIEDGCGVGNAVKRHLAERRITDVTVFCAAGVPRHNVGD